MDPTTVSAEGSPERGPHSAPAQEGPREGTATEGRNQESITHLLHRWEDGDDDALDQLLPIVWGELRRQARRYMERERRGHTLQATALLHETYLRLSELRRISWRDRDHFFAFSARIMRRVLVDHARARSAAKRGDGVRPEPLDRPVPGGASPDIDLVALDIALDRLAERDKNWACIVELRYFAGLTLSETADALDIGVATVSRRWAAARAWLFRELSPPSGSEK